MGVKSTVDMTRDFAEREVLVELARMMAEVKTLGDRELCHLLEELRGERATFENYRIIDLGDE